MSAHPLLFFGSAPSDLRVEQRGDGTVRFRITPLGQREAVADIPVERVAELVSTLRDIIEPDLR